MPFSTWKNCYKLIINECSLSQCNPLSNRSKLLENQTLQKQNYLLLILKLKDEDIQKIIKAP